MLYYLGVITMTLQKRQFIVDEKGRKKSVVLTLREYRELLEDLEDLATIAERKNEPAEPFEVVKARLAEKWRSTQSK